MKVNNTGPLSYIYKYMEQLQSVSKKMATGKAINSASDNPAVAAISEKMNALIKELYRRESNVEDMVNMVQTAEGGLSNVSDILQRMRELAVQASNSTLTDEDRAQIQAEFNQLRQELDRIANTTQFNNKRLLDINAEKLGISDIDLTTSSGAEEALGKLDNAIKTVSSDRGNLGALINGYKTRISNYQVQRENTIATYSRMVDTDYAQASIDYSKFQTLSQIGIETVRRMNELLRMNINLLF